MEDTTVSIKTATYLRDVGDDLPPALLALNGDMNGSLYELSEGETNLGRHPSNHIVLSSAGVSRFHCSVRVRAAEVRITDLNSSNGTFVCGQQIASSAPLVGGETLAIGALTFKFLSANDPERQTYDVLRRRADTDPLTKCYNRGYLSEVLAQECHRAQLLSQPLSLLMFDLDHFKRLNDTHGHPAGDQVLKSIADLVRQRVIRGTDTFARFGGEEFVVLLPGTQLGEAAQVAERLRRCVAEHRFYYASTPLAVTISVGVAEFDGTNGQSPDALFKSADLALYDAKEGGRNRYSVASRSAA